MNSVYDGVHRTLLIGIQYVHRRPATVRTTAAMAIRSIRQARGPDWRNQAALNTPNNTLAVATIEPTIPSGSLPYDSSNRCPASSRSLKNFAALHSGDQGPAPQAGTCTDNMKEM